MRPMTLAVPICAVTLALALGTGAAAPAVPPCANDIPHEPAVLFEITGSTLAGPFDLHLVVHSDGFARLAYGTYDGVGSQARLAVVPPADVLDLAQDLVQLGAGVSCDRFDFTSDVPQSTLTVLRGATDARAHTYSWLGDDGANGAIEQRLNQFIQAAFP